MGRIRFLTHLENNNIAFVLVKMEFHLEHHSCCRSTVQGISFPDPGRLCLCLSLPLDSYLCHSLICTL